MTITREPIAAYLNVLAGAEPAGGYLEVRWRRDGGMGQAFYPTGGRFDEAVTTIRRLGGRTDVYVGAAPRTRRAGGFLCNDGGWVLARSADQADTADEQPVPIDPPP